MEAARRQARELEPDDAVAAGLVPYLERHIPEELHGDEPGADTLEDLVALGQDRVAVKTRLPSPHVAALVGTQYYWIFHYHPVAVLGFLELEAYPPHRPTVERLIEKTGLPSEGFRQMLLHADIDVGHAEELHRVLDSLPLEPEHEELIGLSALQSVELLALALRDAVEDPAPSPDAVGAR